MAGSELLGKALTADLEFRELPWLPGADGWYIPRLKIGRKRTMDAVAYQFIRPFK